MKHYQHLFTFQTQVENFKYMIEFMTSNLAIKDKND